MWQIYHQQPLQTFYYYSSSFEIVSGTWGTRACKKATLLMSIHFTMLICHPETYPSPVDMQIIARHVS